jgi:hypothetical protein
MQQMPPSTPMVEAKVRQMAEQEIGKWVRS